MQQRQKIWLQSEEWVGIYVEEKHIEQTPLSKENKSRVGLAIKLNKKTYLN